MTNGLRDRVAILGMGCTRFGERWDCDAEDLMLEAYLEALDDAGIELKEIEAAWLGVFQEEISLGKSALPLSVTLRLPNIPVTRVENMCATGVEALRGAVYAVAAGACDIAMALGVEKLKDSGYGGLPARTMGMVTDLWLSEVSAPGAFAQIAGAYAAKHGIRNEDLKKAMAHVSWKSHQNGARNPRAHLRNTVTMNQIMNAPMVAEPLGLYDCCGVSDGAACAIVTTPEIARGLGKTDIVTVKALQLASSDGTELCHTSWDGAGFPATRAAARAAYAEADIDDPRDAFTLTEVHDCFSVTELVTMEELGFSEPGRAAFDVLNGDFDRDGRMPCQVDGGLKCFGHPVGASGLRMIYEGYLQLQGRAGERQLESPSLMLAHNMGGRPYQHISAIAIIGHDGF